MTNGDVVIGDYDLLDKQSCDALSISNVEHLGMNAQTRQERRKRLREPQVSRLLGKLGIERLKFSVKALLALPKYWHSAT